MRAITIVAIAAAAAAGIIAAVFMLYIPVNRSIGDGGQQQELVAGGTTPNNGYTQVKVTVNGFELMADVAATSDQKSKGLAVKDTLNEDEGMLFLFSRETPHSFWMKDMKFPIDIIWLDSNKTVVHIEHSLEPCSPISCPTYEPDAGSLYVLETVAGFAEKHGVRDGTKVEFQLDM